MLGDLISSKTRIKLLLKFFLNSSTSSHLRGLAEEFNESTNAVRLELKRLEEAKMLISYPNGNKKIYKANTSHPLFGEIHHIVRKHLGIDQVILNVIERLGDIEKAYLTGSFANGEDAQIIDIVLIGKLEVAYLSKLIKKVESIISRRIRYIHYSSENWSEEVMNSFDGHPLLIWEKKQEIA